MVKGEVVDHGYSLREVDARHAGTEVESRVPNLLDCAGQVNALSVKAHGKCTVADGGHLVVLASLSDLIGDGYRVAITGGPAPAVINAIVGDADGFAVCIDEIINAIGCKIIAHRIHRNSKCQAGGKHSLEQEFKICHNLMINSQ